MLSDTPCDQTATASQPSAFFISPAATARAKASRIFSRVRRLLLMLEVSARIRVDLECRYPKRLFMMRIAPGPMMITNRAGRTHRISGKTIFTGVCCAFASAV